MKFYEYEIALLQGQLKSSSNCCQSKLEAINKSFTSKTGKAYVVIILLGIVSLMGNVVYEGSRVVPGYFAFLGASAFVVAFIGLLGEFLGYVLRLVSGGLSDTTQAYRFFMFLGYGLIISMPLLGFSHL